MTDEPSIEVHPVNELRWQFDPANPPDVWTKGMVGTLTLKEVEHLADHDNGLLSKSSQASFDDAYRELNAELVAKFKPVSDKLAQRAMSPGLTDTMKKLQSMASASAKIPKFEMPAVENLRRYEAQQAQHQAEMAALTDAIGEAQRHKEDRANAQAKATLEIAQAQRRLQEMQEEAIELARHQAEATAEVVHAQQAVVDAVTEELAVLREQTLGQRALIRSGWASGVVMEWTLFVAVIAAVATIALGTIGAASISTPIWIGSAVATALLAAALLIWQLRRRPPSHIS